MENWFFIPLAIVIGIAIVLIPRLLYQKDVIDRDEWLGIMIGIMTVLTLLQVILAVLKVF
jgi:hypothetical protein